MELDLPAGWTTGSVATNGVTLQCYRTGSASERPPLVFVHGFNDTGRRWVPLGEALAADRAVIAYDARGHGRSDAPETGYGIDDRIADLRAVIDGHGLSPPVLVGHSLGAATVGWAIARGAVPCRGAVLVAPDCLHECPTASPEELIADSRAYLETFTDRTVADIVAERYPEQDPVHARRLASGHLENDPVIAELAGAGYPAPLADVFGAIDVPTLVLCADGDVERRVADLEAAAGLSAGRLVHLPDADHYVVRTAFDAALAELRTFLRRLE